MQRHMLEDCPEYEYYVLTKTFIIRILVAWVQIRPENEAVSTDRTRTLADPFYSPRNVSCCCCCCFCGCNCWPINDILHCLILNKLLNIDIWFVIFTLFGASSLVVIQHRIWWWQGHVWGKKWNLFHVFHALFHFRILFLHHSSHYLFFNWFVFHSYLLLHRWHHSLHGETVRK